MAKNYQNGWLEPSGKFHPLDDTHSHCNECVNSGFIPCQQEADKYLPYRCKKDFLGWAKLTGGQWIIARPYKITKQQYNFIFDWYIVNNKELDGFMKIMESKNVQNKLLDFL